MSNHVSFITFSGRMKIADFSGRRLLGLCLLCLATSAMAQSTASLSFAEGKVLLLRGAVTYGMEAGVKLETGDMLETEVKSQAQVEFADGLILNLGPQSKLYLLSATPAAGKPVVVALASGWLKAAVPSGRKGAARELQYLLPTLEVDTKDATVVLHAASPVDEAFIESGAATAAQVAPDGAKGQALALKGGDYVSLKEGAVAIGRPPAGFFSGVPRHYMDNLPALYAKVKDMQREPAREHDTTYAEVGVWLRASKTVRQGLLSRYQSRVKDPEFHGGLIANLSAHPEWERVVGAAKKK
jgi:hypothetical protein